jgi:hypothetical protein
MTELAPASAGKSPGAESSANATQTPPPVAPSTPPAVEPSKTQEGAPPDLAKKDEATKDQPEAKKEEASKEIVLKAPEGSKLDAAHVEKIATFAKERGFTQEQAQAILERDDKTVSDFVATQEKNVANWKAETEADPEVGGEKFKEASELAKRFVHRFADKELLKELDDTGYGNNKLLVRMFYRAGKELGEDRLVQPGSQTRVAHEPTSASEILYPKKIITN